jgi:hypothetical protein
LLSTALPLALKDLSYNWVAEKLDTYVRNPDPFLEKDQRM